MPGPSPLRIPFEFIDTATSLATVSEDQYERAFQALSDRGEVVARRSLASTLDAIGFGGDPLLDMLLSLGGLRSAVGVESTADIAMLVSESKDLSVDLPREPSCNEAWSPS